MAGTHASGRTRHSSRTKVEGSLALDVNVLAKAGCLQPGREAEWQWNHNSGPIAAVEIVAEASRLNVSYNRYGIDAREPVIQAIDLIRVPRQLLDPIGSRPGRRMLDRNSHGTGIPRHWRIVLPLVGCIRGTRRIAERLQSNMEHG